MKSNFGCIVAFLPICAVSSIVSDNSQLATSLRKHTVKRKLNSCKAATCRNSFNQEVQCETSLSRCRDATPYNSPFQACDSSSEYSFNLYFTTDSYGGETFFVLKSSSGLADQVGPMEFANYRSFHLSACLPKTVCYNFTMADLQGNGMCCENTTPLGSYSGYDLFLDGTAVKSGGKFTYSESFYFGNCPVPTSLLSPVMPPVVAAPVPTTALPTLPPPKTFSPTIPSPIVAAPSFELMTQTPVAFYVGCTAPTDCAATAGSSCCFNSAARGCICQPSSSADCVQNSLGLFVKDKYCGGSSLIASTGPPVLVPTSVTSPVSTPTMPSRPQLQPTAPISPAEYPTSPVQLPNTSNPEFSLPNGAVNLLPPQLPESPLNNLAQPTVLTFCPSPLLHKVGPLALPQLSKPVKTLVEFVYYLVLIPLGPQNLTAEQVEGEVLPVVEKTIASSMRSGCDDALPPPPPIGKNLEKKGGRRRTNENNRKNSKRSQLAKKDSPIEDRVIAIDSNPPDKVGVNETCKDIDIPVGGQCFVIQGMVKLLSETSTVSPKTQERYTQAAAESMPSISGEYGEARVLKVQMLQDTPREPLGVSAISSENSSATTANKKSHLGVSLGISFLVASIVLIALLIIRRKKKRSTRTEEDEVHDSSNASRSERRKHKDGEGRDTLMILNSVDHPIDAVIGRTRALSSPPPSLQSISRRSRGASRSVILSDASQWDGGFELEISMSEEEASRSSNTYRRREAQSLPAELSSVVPNSSNEQQNSKRVSWARSLVDSFSFGGSTAYDDDDMVTRQTKQSSTVRDASDEINTTCTQRKEDGYSNFFFFPGKNDTVMI